MSSIKETLHAQCLASIEQRAAAIRQSMDDAHQAGIEDTKSSAGDKYETGRAMMHLEMEKLSTQLSEAEKSKSALLKINPAKAYATVQTGSLVLTDNGNYYLSVSAGAFKLEGQTFVTLSTASPLGAILLGRAPGDQIQLNGKTITIHQVA